jgi:hypothetical protein
VEFPLVTKAQRAGDGTVLGAPWAEGDPVETVVLTRGSRRRMDASATGMTFLDSEIPALVGAPLDAMIFTCVGVPDYRTTPGGLPGVPVDVRQMQHRD